MISLPENYQVRQGFGVRAPESRSVAHCLLKQKAVKAEYERRTKAKFSCRRKILRKIFGGRKKLWEKHENGAEKRGLSIHPFREQLTQKYKKKNT